MSSSGSHDVQSLSHFEIRDARRWTQRRAVYLLGGCGAVILLIFFLLILFLLIVPALRPMPPAVAITPCGKVTGLLEDRTYAFLGLPYAFPPVGQLRFRRPRDVYNLDSCRKAFKTPPTDASHYRGPCVQKTMLDGTVEGSEDCLYLNVHTPSLEPSRKLPVIVSVGGLFFLYGGGHQSGFRVTPSLVQATEAVHVSLNSRLGAFGFLPPSGEPNANLGLWDVVSALRWVQANIWAFGGDKDNVVLLGYGSGASTALALSLAAQYTFGLFHKVWLCSPMLRVDHTVAEATKFYSGSRCVARKCLDNLTGSNVASVFSMTRDMRRDWFELPRGDASGRKKPGFLLKDDLLIPESFSNSTAHRLGNIPVVIGSTTNEVDVLLSPYGMRVWNIDDYHSYMKNTLGPLGADLAALRSLYPVTASSLEEVFTRLITDARVTCPLLCFARDLRPRTARLYQYVARGLHRYVDPYSFQFRVNNSFHGWDALLLFHDGSLDRMASRTGEHEAPLVAELRRALKDFAWTGRISAFSPSEVNMLGLTGVSTQTNYRSRECQFWLRLAAGDCFRHAWVA